ncbi:MAG: putative inorganic carbon transporter subunit DabA, partial [Pirellula sp.]
MQWLHNAIHEAAHLLPSQGPIGVFIHHNTLHAFEHQSFDHAVRTGHQVFGFEPYLSEDRYREELTRGRIHFSELNIVLERDLGQTAANSILGLATRLDLRIAMLQYPLRSGQDAELNWFMAETESLHRMRQDVSEVHRRRFVNDTRNWIMRRVRGSSSELIRPAWLNGLLIRFEEMHIESWSDADWEAFTLNALWEVCLAGVQQSVDPTGASKLIRRHRDLLVSLGGLDSDQLVDDVLIRLCAVFLDQGIGHWEMPGREIGLYDAFCALYERGSIGDAWWLSGLSSELKRLKSLRVGPLASIHESLQALGVSHDETLAYLSSTLLALRGWAGMIWHVEERADRVHHGIPPGSLIDFLAVRLILEQFALRVCARDTLGYTEKLSELRTVLGASLTPNAPNRDKPRAYAIFQLAQILGWTPERLFLLESHEWRILLDEVEGFGKLDRRRIFHLAYEHRFRVQTLNALAVHSASRSTPAERPTFQAVFCIDEREESIRRHVEEVAPTAETFGVAGFFGVIMYYRGAAAADFVPLCPVVVRPQHWVSETVDLSLLASHERRRITRRRVGMTLQAFHGGSRRIVSGAFLSATIGLLATIPLVAHVMFPRLTARFQKFFGRFISPPPKTRLLLERSTPKSSPIEDEHGFLLSEMIDMMERLLRDMGLASRFSRLVFLIGHGSTSMNNPHESAHDCGACG